MNSDLSDIRKRTVSANQYIESLEQPFRDKFLAIKKAYQLKKEATDQLKKYAGEYAVVVFSAEWCKDCAANIPVLALISEATGLEVRIFGHLMKDPLSHTRKWRIPPSPPEVETFQVDKIPLMIVLNKDGEAIGKIVENPQKKPTLEEELIQIILEQH